MRSIRIKFILMAVALSLLLAVPATWNHSSSMAETLETRIQSELATVAVLKQAKLDTFLTRMGKDADGLARSDALLAFLEAGDAPDAAGDE